MEVTVCTWEPKHTAERVAAQQRALAKGVIAKLVKEHGKGTDALQQALVSKKLVSVRKSERGELTCPECGALMETVLAGPGITDRLEAVKDVADDFSAAIERTRDARSK